jgi:hypothetical protein
MNRRNFLSSMIGGVTTAAAVRTWPFRVYSFPSEIKLVKRFPFKRFPFFRPIKSTLLEEIMAIPGVISCEIRENFTQRIDADGQPAYSIQPIVTGGDDFLIASAIFTHKPIGYYSHGNVEVIGTDPYCEVPIKINFTRNPSGRPLHP